MNEQPTPRSLIVDLGVLLVSEVLGYIAFLVNVPFALSLVATIFVIVIVLQDVYGLEPLRLLAWTGIPAKGHFHADLKDFLRFYAIAAFALFLVREIVRAVFRLKRPTFRRRLLTRSSCRRWDGRGVGRLRCGIPHRPCIGRPHR